MRQPHTHAAAWLVAALLGGNAAGAAAQQAPVLATTAAPAPAMTLAQAYRLAVDNDATLRAARAGADSKRERLPQARAQLMPNISASASRYENSLESVAPNFLGVATTTNRNYASSTKSLSLRQPLYRPYQFADLQQAHAVVEEANASLEKEVQNLAVRVTAAYLGVLSAQDQMALVQSQKSAYATQLDAARKRFAGGAGTRTDIDQAQAQLDLSVAQELEARQNFDYARQALYSVVGVPVVSVAVIDEKRLPLTPPTPDRLEDWIAKAEDSSPELRAQRALVEESRQEIEKARAGHKPTLDFVASRTLTDSETTSTVNQKNDTTSVGVQLNVPLFAGGYVNSTVRAAVADQTRAQEALEALRRDLNLRVIKEYRGITEGVLKVRALEQAVRSAEVAVDSTRKSYLAGVRTVVDVFTTESQLAQARRELLDARYVYLLSRIRLRALAGEADLAAIDEASGWLKP